MSVRHFAVIGLVAQLTEIKDVVDTMAISGNPPPQEQYTIYEDASNIIKAAILKLSDALKMESR
jgi:hypothetical protein